MKKRCYLAVIISIAFLISSFPAFAAGTEEWIECASSCAPSKCDSGNGVCCKNTEKIDALGKYCCAESGASIWQTPACCIDNDGDLYGISYSVKGNILNDKNSCKYPEFDCNDNNANINPGKVDICDGLDNDCNPATVDGLGEAAPACGLQTGVCADFKKKCGGAKGWLDCSTAEYSANYEKTESKCNDNLDNDCDGKADCVDADCAGKTGAGGALCCQKAADCVQNKCVQETCETGTSYTCSYKDRAVCDSTECSLGQCDKGGSAGGACKTAEESSEVCLNCATDTTLGAWSSNPSNHEDAGKGYGSNLFDSNGAACTPASGGACYDSSNKPVNHKPKLSTGACCGNDANEYYKPDYYGIECTSDVNDCVWSTGDAQPSNTGNAKWWCYQHEWYECKDDTIGAKAGGATCVGTIGNNAWQPNSFVPAPPVSNPQVPNPLVKTEDQYSCTDGIDNDGDGKTDCADIDCGTTVSGYVRDESNNPLYRAKVDITQSATSTLTNNNGLYDFGKVNCGTYDMMASADGHVSSTKSQVKFTPTSSVTQDFTLAKGKSCEADCTYAADNTIHAECDGINGCKFCPQGCSFCDVDIAKQSCNLAQPGWDRIYDDPNRQECINGCIITCPSGCPQAKIETRAKVTCSEGKNLIKITKIVAYKGKLTKLNVVVCE